MAVASLVLGIFGVLFSFYPILGLVPSLVAMILGIVSRKQLADRKQPSGMAIAGMILGIVGTVCGATVFALCAMCAKNFADAGREIGKQIDKAAEEAKKLEAEEAAHPLTLGMPVKFNDSTWIVTAAKDLGPVVKAAHRSSERSEGRFVEVSFRVTNDGLKEDSLFEVPVLVDDRGREFKRWPETPSYLGTRSELFMLGLPPAIAKEASEIYEVAADAKGLKVKVRSLASSFTNRKVSLGF